MQELTENDEKNQGRDGYNAQTPNDTNLQNVTNMTTTLTLAIWDANDLLQHRQELNTFLINHKIDIMMTSKTHFIKKHFLRHHNYAVYHTEHPDKRVDGGSSYGGEL